jgi:hypothetical protein
MFYESLKRHPLCVACGALGASERPRLPHQPNVLQPQLQRDPSARGCCGATVARILGEPVERQHRYGGAEYFLYAAERVALAERSRDDWRKSE